MATRTDDTQTAGSAIDVGTRIERLTAAAGKRVIEPDVEVEGSVGSGQVLPDELLSVAGLDLDLPAAARTVLSREEVASIVQAGIRFEAVLIAGFAAEIAAARDLTDPRLTFILHEVGEETRHQRLFQRLLAQLDPKAKSPIPFRLLQFAYRTAVHNTERFPAFFYALVLAGEEIPDLFQKRAAEHPDTDPFLRDVNRYHRMEEARHLSFARAVYPDVWSRAGVVDRALVRRLAPRDIRVMFDMIVHPGVYRLVGLPAFRTWRRANRTAQRVQTRWEATRPVLQVLLDAGVFRRGRVPRGWRRLCGVDRRGRPLADLVDRNTAVSTEQGSATPS